MAELSRKRLEDIVKKQAPGYRIVDEPKATGDRAAKRAKPDANVPETKVMREKYRRQGPGTPQARRKTTRAAESEKAGAKTVVRIAPAQSADASVMREHPKVIIVSDKGKITSSQG